MAADAPDPRTFKSWEDAFQYPIPAVRGMEKKLRSSASENQDKLRTLVGASYRELLGTARTIVKVNEQMHQVENGLTNMGKRSDSRLVSKMNDNYIAFEKHCNSREKERFASTSQIAVLQSTLRIVTQLLEKNQDSLLVAKLLVIARLLYKTLSESNNQPTLLAKLRSRLVSRRQKLLRHIDRQLSQPDRTVSDIVNDLSAFSLATSAMPSDVLKHFHHIRLESVTRSTESDPSVSGQENLSSASSRLKQYLETVKLSREIFPKLLSEALSTLGSQPLVRDRKIHQIHELELDIHDKWFSDEIRNFTPWLQHNELDVSKASELIDKFASRGLQSFTEYLTQALKAFDITKVALTRKEIFEMWLGSKQRSQLSIPTLEGVEMLNAPFEARFVEIIRSYFANLDRLPTVINQSLDRLGSHAQDGLTLWDDSTLAIEITDGAVAFREAIVNRRSGRSKALGDIIRVYEQCNSNVADTRKTLKDLRSVRWDDYLDDEESDAASDAILKVLVPPSASGSVEAELHSAALATIANIDAAMLEIVNTGSFSSPDTALDATATKKAANLLRMIRELRQRLPTLLHDAPAPNTRPFGHQSVTILHANLVAHVLTTTTQAFAAAATKFLRSPAAASTALWAGTPPLPVQPAPLTFRLLRTVVQAMDAAGADLWATVLAALLKARLAHALAAALRDAIEDAEAPPAALTQLLFDVRYLLAALAGAEGKESGNRLMELAVSLEAQAGLEAGQSERIGRAAAAYWRRTYLLFGLLA